MSWDYSTYYEENKDDINRRRRNKYRKDRNFREGRRAAARDAHRKSKIGKPPADRKVIVTSDTHLFSIGRVAETINRKVQTVREYHQNGVIPEPLFFDSRGWRLYTAAQVNLMRTAFESFDQKQIKTLADVGKVLSRRWGQ